MLASTFAAIAKSNKISNFAHVTCNCNKIKCLCGDGCGISGEIEGCCCCRDLSTFARKGSYNKIQPKLPLLVRQFKKRKIKEFNLTQIAQQ